MKTIVYVHGLGGGGDSRIPGILAERYAARKEAPDNVRIVCRTYDFDPDRAAAMLEKLVQEEGPDLIIGVSTHNRDELLAAQRDGCSYLNIGPIFPTGTKSWPMNPLGTDMLTKLIPEVSVPFSVMGGIKISHLKQLHSLGCRHIAAVTAFTQADNPASEIRKWIQELK